ncbi:lipid-binding protein [Mangrovimonas yunxiaonensis]|uniref:Lipid-binding protein n=1 Tax=Mangrovimonas yunxiaonensis TaxID=1197477 RepID=A0A084TIJ4_9FLAO|nr:YceI family protein [Mangrovimonas yunxiaonensis]KFB00530.1 lipid-binding protein [Mangrovimonas yunxiaonensis]MBR9757169.1 YceI family protein [Algicola sp.]GGH47335.1 polyisoprenoid-binding protein [Mangrovimonas yunxiaonensis]
MKKQILNFLTIVAISTALVGCKKAKEAETKAAEEVAETTAVSVKYKVDPGASTVSWKGFKPTGSHHGVVGVESGVINVKEGVVESGTFLIDMKSLEVMDIPAEDEMNAKLSGHLKSADFFDVEVYPAAAFSVTGFTTENGKSTLSGNLKMKDAENNVTIPVTVVENGDTVTIKSETFTIDRSKWNVKYKSKSFFEDLGDKFINDDIELQVNVVAKKA